MTVGWHRTEPRDVRPFAETAKAEDSLSETGICLFSDDDISVETSFDLDEIDFQKLSISLHVRVADPSTWKPEELEASNIELAVIAKHRFLKRSVVVFRSDLVDATAVEVSVSPDFLAGLGGGRNVQVIVALCLKADRAPAPGKPYVTGHWLAQKTFHLRSRTNPVLFDVRTRTDEEWKSAGYPAKTFFSVEYSGGIEAELDDGESVAIVYVHLDAHHKMVDSSVGRSVQPILSAEIILSVLQQSYKDWEGINAIDPASPLATLAKQLGQGAPMTLDELKKSVADPAKLRARLQDRLSVVQSL